MNRRSFLKAIAALPAALTLPAFCQRGPKAEVTKKIDASWNEQIGTWSYNPATGMWAAHLRG